ncbi:MAG: sulfotransferase domain-containing protein [Gemmatimonadetes bacterium]|nr:sulfotransferase domain-containing protein [Gemmatimonadota bacterium]MBK7784071.1 sulfotransferase domain-containing protein [Gemmatimonadota bacterium]
MSLVWWILTPIAVLIGLYIVLGVYLSMVLKWEDEQSVGLRYYGLPPAGRDAFKRTLARHARLLAPLLWLNAKLARMDFRRVGFQYKGVAAPHGSCSPETFARAEAYAPRPEDVFVATQMKCGTTWMEHIVYEVLHRGAGRLVETGTALYAVAPWLEGRKSVSLEEAPRLGTERPSRVIKTHLPAQLCPSAAAARYIYVARHPVSCFASCIDFVLTNVGGMAPELPAFEEWYCSPELMWWGTWPDHVRGWWERSRRDGNVLFVLFEDLKQDPAAVIRQVTQFLGMAPLTDAELAQVVEKTSFKYMQRHQGSFEMHPPHILQTNAELFVSGTANRHEDVPEAVRQRIAAWSVAALAGSDVPVARMYPDLPAAGGA